MSKTATFQHTQGHAVTVFIQHVCAVQIGKDYISGKGVDCTLIQFGAGWSIPVIESRESILKAFAAGGKDRSQANLEPRCPECGADVDENCEGVLSTCPRFASPVEGD